MSVAAIVAEYNPFHKGHAYQLEKTKQAGFEQVVAVMSGNFVQRAEPALMNKHARAKAAVKNGVDLVIELPTPWATAGAMFFARGAIHLLGSLGFVDTISFGSESGDTKLVKKAARAVDCASVNSGLIGELMAQGNSFARARALVVESLFGPQIAQVLASPNDNLALEYVRAAETLGLHFDFLATKRKGAGHDQAGIFEGFASASQIRQNVALGESIEALLPAASYEVFKEEFENFRASADYKKLEAAVLYALRSKTAADIAKVPDISEGIENRIHFAASQAVSLEDLFEKAKAKRYSHARIRRIVLHAFLGIEASQTEGLPPYIRILAIGDGGKSLLKQAAQSAKLPLVMRAADVKGLDEKSKALFALESRATDIYNISLPKILPSGSDYRAEIFVS